MGQIIEYAAIYTTRGHLSTFFKAGSPRTPFKRSFANKKDQPTPLHLLQVISGEKQYQKNVKINKETKVFSPTNKWKMRKSMVNIQCYARFAAREVVLIPQCGIAGLGKWQMENYPWKLILLKIEVLSLKKSGISRLNLPFWPSQTILPLDKFHGSVLM